MSKNLVLVLAVLFSSMTASAQQRCYEGQPPQLNLSCEYVSGKMYLRFEVVDVTNLSLVKRLIYMGTTLFEGRENCDKQLQMIKSSAVATVVQKPMLVAVCATWDPKLVRMILSPQYPYIKYADEKEIGNLDDCLSEMDLINNQN